MSTVGRESRSAPRPSGSSHRREAAARRMVQKKTAHPRQTPGRSRSPSASERESVEAKSFVLGAESNVVAAELAERHKSVEIVMIDDDVGVSGWIELRRASGLDRCQVVAVERYPD